MAHYPIIQKELDKLLAKDTTEPLNGGAGYYSTVFVIPKCIGGYNPFSIISDLSAICTYLLLRCLPSDGYGNLFNKIIRPLLLISWMFIYTVLLLSITMILFDKTNFSVEGFAIWAFYCP